MGTNGRSREVIVSAGDIGGLRRVYKVCTTRDYFLDRQGGVEDNGMERRAGGSDFWRRLDLREFCVLGFVLWVFGLHARGDPTKHARWTRGKPAPQRSRGLTRATVGRLLYTLRPQGWPDGGHVGCHSSDAASGYRAAQVRLLPLGPHFPC